MLTSVEDYFRIIFMIDNYIDDASQYHITKPYEMTENLPLYWRV